MDIAFKKDDRVVKMHCDAYTYSDLDHTLKVKDGLFEITIDNVDYVEEI